MVKPVTGYTTEDGVYYDEEIDALLHECRKKIERAISPKWSLANKDELSYTLVLAFIERNAKIVNEYTKHYMEKYPQEDEAQKVEDSNELHLPLET